MRKKRTRATIQASLKENEAPTRLRRHRRGTNAADLDRTQKAALVCKYFCEGHPPTEIRELLETNHGITILREDPYRYLAYAASQHWIRFVAPHEHTLREALISRYGWLQGMDVVHTAVVDDVAFHAAEMLIGLVQLHRRPPYNQTAVHVGFAGGHAIRRLAQIFADLMRQPRDDLPATVVFHAMVAGFDVEDPTTDPNAFFTYFVKDPAIQVETRFVALHAPPMVETRQLETLRRMAGLMEAFEKARELDVIVTSASSWSDSCSHSMLRKYMGQKPVSLRKLEQAGCRADMLWRPLGETGPIDTTTAIRAMTLMELSELRGFIEAGKHVLLVLGPCGTCNALKTQALETVLNLKEPLITHLAVDSRTAAALLRNGGQNR